MGFIGTLKKTLKPIISSWTKAKSMQFFERPGDTTETSRLRLELRQAVLKGVGYLFLYLFITWVILPRIPIANDYDENTSALEIMLPIVTFAVLGIAEGMKVKWLFNVLRKKNRP